MGKETETSHEIPASSEELTEAEVFSVSHSFRLEWKVSKKAFTDRSHARRPMPKNLSSLKLREYNGYFESSTLFEFKDLKIHPFNLVLFITGSNACELVLVAISPRPELEYAFVCINDRPLYVPISNKSPPPYMKAELFTPRSVASVSKEYITIICGISAISGVNLSPPKEVSSDLEDGNRLVWGSFLPGLPALPPTSWSSKTSSTGEEAFFRYFFGGELPTLDVGLAKDMLVVSSSRTSKKDAELKALCVEYLAKNLAAKNVAGVMKVACDNHVKYLVERCNEFISEHCDIVDKRS